MNATSIPTAVVFDGPFPDVDREGDEIPCWSVSLVNDDNDDIRTYTVYSYDRAETLALNIARDRKIEYVRDASRA